MTLSRRVAAIESALSPTQLVVGWLAEAHTFGDVGSYVVSVIVGDPPVSPLDRLACQVARGARNSTKGKRPEIVEAQVRAALRDTVFRFELAVRINVAAQEMLEREALIDAALVAQIALLTLGENRDPKNGQRLARLRDQVILRVDELHATQEVRSVVEGRYLDGHAALFPDVAHAWDEQVHSTKVIADMAARLAELEGSLPPVPPGPERLSHRTAELIADLVEPAKAAALEKIDEGRRAFGIATGWLRSRLGGRRLDS
jgi:hypothetical protein